MKTVTLKLQGYHIEGVSDLSMWGGGNACIPMESFKVKKLKEILENLNDNGFGVESINGAVCAIYRDYGKFHEFARTITVGEVSQHTYEMYYQM